MSGSFLEKSEPFSHAHLGENSVSGSDSLVGQSGSLRIDLLDDRWHIAPAVESRLDHERVLDSAVYDQRASFENDIDRSSAPIHPQGNYDKTDKPFRLEQQPFDGFFERTLCVKEVYRLRFRMRERMRSFARRGRFYIHPTIGLCR